MLIDSHTHLTDEKFSEDRHEILGALNDNGVEIILNPSCNLEESRLAIELAEKYSYVYAGIGFYPNELDDMNYEKLAELKKLAEHEKVIAIGEIGLDYYWDDSKKDLQKKWFREQIRLANELDLPYIVHNRDAHGDTLAIMTEEKKENTRGILHCFSGSVELAQDFIKLGFLISLAGPVTFKNSKMAKKVATEIPLEYLLIETDAPYLTPEPFRGKRNEPKNVRYVAEQIAILKGVSYDRVVEVTANNFRRLFNL